jgi:hypothetical protein
MLALLCGALAALSQAEEGLPFELSYREGLRLHTRDEAFELKVTGRVFAQLRVVENRPADTAVPLRSVPDTASLLLRVRLRRLQPVARDPALVRDGHPARRLPRLAPLPRARGPRRPVPRPRRPGGAVLPPLHGPPGALAHGAAHARPRHRPPGLRRAGRGGARLRPHAFERGQPDLEPGGVDGQPDGRLGTVRAAALASLPALGKLPASGSTPRPPAPSGAIVGGSCRRSSGRRGRRACRRRRCSGRTGWTAASPRAG